MLFLQAEALACSWICLLPGRLQYWHTIQPICLLSCSLQHWHIILLIYPLSCRLQYWQTFQLESLPDPAESSVAGSGAESSPELPASTSQPSGLRCPSIHSHSQQPTCRCDDSMSSQAAQAMDRTGSDQASKLPEEEEQSAGGGEPVLPSKGRKVLVPLGGGKDSLTVFELLKVSIQGLAGGCRELLRASNRASRPLHAASGVVPNLGKHGLPLLLPCNTTVPVQQKMLGCANQTASCACCGR